MSNLPQTFDFNGLPVDVHMINGEPHWVAKDICEILEVGNHRQAISRLEDDEKGVILNDTLGGAQRMIVVNEPGLYSLIMGSRKPVAKDFRRWVTHEVIPTIRKTGAYVAPGAQPAVETVLLQVVTVVAKQMENLSLVVGKLVDDMQQVKTDQLLAPPLRLESQPRAKRSSSRAQPSLYVAPARDWEAPPDRYEGYPTIAKVRYMMAHYQKQTRKPFPSVYGQLYDRYERASGISFRAEWRHRRPDLSAIVYIEDYGDIDLLYEIAVNMLEEIGEVA